MTMTEVIGMTLGGLAVLGLVCIGSFLWLRKRRMDQAVSEMAEEADQQKSGGGGGPKPVK
jgi:uncharacterized iron-regulated membrane protein